MQTPLVTVLLPTHNSARYLAEAIESILSQSCKDLELVVLDGGSSDPTLDIVKAYAVRDRRVRLESFPGTHPCKRIDDFLPSLKSRYVAMQHSDDVSYHNRMAEQIRAFAEDRELGVCSALCRSFWHDRMQPARAEGAVIHPKPERHAAIKASLLFWWVMHCPTFMFDREKITAAGLTFSNPYMFSNDYWQTVTNIDKLKYSNIQQELSAYRLHMEGDGARNREALQQEGIKLKGDILRHFGFECTPREMEIHANFRVIPDNIVGATTAEGYDEVLRWLENLRAQNDAKGIFDRPIFTALVNGLLQRTLELKARQNLKPS